MERSIELMDLISRPEMLQFLEALGESLSSRCAILRYPSKDERDLLEKYAHYLRSRDAEVPDERTLDRMWEGLKSLGYYEKNAYFGTCDFCETLRKSHLADLRCAYSNYTHATKAYEQGTSVLYVCHAGLFDMVAPIVIADRHEADLFIGQNHREQTEAEISALYSLYDLMSKNVTLEGFMASYKSDRERRPCRESPKVQEDTLSERSRLLAELARLLSHYATKRLADRIFSDLWSHVHAYQTPNEVMAQVMRALRNYVAFDSSGVWTKNTSRPGWLTCLYSDYATPDDPEIAKGMREHEGLGGQAIATGNTFHLDTAAKIDAITVPSQCTTIRARRGLKTFLAVPLKLANESAGFVEIGATREKAFWQGTVAMMEEVARYLSLFFSLRSEMAHGWNLTASDSTPATHFASIAQYLVTEIPEVTGCLGCTVFSISPDQQFLECEATTGILGYTMSTASTERLRYDVNSAQLTTWAFRNRQTINLPSRDTLTPNLHNAHVPALPIHREAIRSPSGSLLSADECDKLPVIVTPIFLSGQPHGVLRIVGRAGGGPFTAEECALVEQLATTLAHPDAIRRSLLRILELAPTLVGVLDADILCYYFLTLVTHGNAVGLNRAFLFDYDATDRSLRPLAAIGPASHAEAEVIKQQLAQESPSLRSSFAAAEIGKKPGRESALFRVLPPGLVMRAGSAVARLLEERHDTVAVAEAPPDVISEFSEWLPSVGLGKAVACTVRVRWQNQAFLLICDNFYSGEHFSDGQLSLLRIVASLFQRAMHLLTRERDFDALKSRSWRQAVDTIAHNLGNKLPFVEDGIARALEKPSLFTDRVFVSSILERIRSAIRDSHDLRRADLPVEPSRRTTTVEILELVQQRLIAEKYANVRLEFDCADCPSAPMMIDQDRLMECFSILCKNAEESRKDDLLLRLGAKVIQTRADPSFAALRRTVRI